MNAQAEMTPEVLFGVGIVILLAALVYGAFRAGHLNHKQQRRTDAATREMQRRKPESRPAD